jgi:hypothetical protein
MFAILFAAAVTAITPAQPQLDLQTSAAVANYLLMSRACDQLLGSNNFDAAHDDAARVLLTAGFSLSQSEGMINQLIKSTIPAYAAQLQTSANGSAEAIRYFCISSLPEKRQAVADAVRMSITNR